MLSLVPQQGQGGTLASNEILFNPLELRCGQQWASFWNSPALSVQATTPIHYGTSNVILSPLPYDYHLHEILDVTRAFICNIGPPTIADFMLDDSPNALSHQLKIYKDPFKRRQKQTEFFASYWILYLFFRLQVTVTLDQTTLEESPSWMHPTKLQQEVKHLGVLSTVYWGTLGLGEVETGSSMNSRV
ncbi:hypothetical protein CDV36_012987 [Fusarium kuroshium]|uniref:Uncharacterized protein n=2 Tax=Fusarium solani species complex TaxID=232080 RepID=A0A3M2RQ59_9HYPO|nr:hypothetical protein CDV36_012987 [Fusarium kuroshium]RSL92415.1 hypothetical protein CEP52_013830 [Fusarium oligoseptatum]